MTDSLDGRRRYLSRTRLPTLVRAFFDGWIFRFGAPKTITTTDQGTQFEPYLFKALTDLIGSHRTRTSAYHPASNGIIERWHRSLKAAIRCHEKKNWLDALPAVLLGLGCSLKEDIKASAEMVYGTTLRLPAEYFYDEQTQPNPHIFVERFRKQMRNVRPTRTAHHIKQQVFTHNTLYTCTHVFLRVSRIRRSLEAPYEGPFEIIQRLTDRLFQIKIKGEAVNVPIERLKPAFTEIRHERGRITGTAETCKHSKPETCNTA